MLATQWITFGDSNSSSDYPIYSGDKITSELDRLINLSSYSKCLLITESILKDQIPNSLSPLSKLDLPGGESIKIIDNIPKI